ncbi:hypothetical protein B0H19DRAFT_1253958 [Mycena capillaripes]|nr:hypothetical protein B0H19DRAFT_1253958 [Mycena capillaripes]
MAERKQNAVWTKADVTKFLDHLITEVASAGDGGNFKIKVFKDAADVVNAIRTVGGLHTKLGCKGKYAALRKRRFMGDYTEH